MSEIAPEPQQAEPQQAGPTEAEAQAEPVPQEPAVDAAVADDQGNDAPVVPTDATPEPQPVDERDAYIAELEDRIAELESSPAPDGDPGSFLGVRTPALDAFEENQFQGEVQAWERDTGLSYDDPDPVVTHVDEAVQAKADETEVG